MKSLQSLKNFGVINIDKPSGPTSFTVSNFLKKQLGVSKTSHMGTLDPKVTGVLPVTLGRACKLAGYIITHDKDYIGVFHAHGPQDMQKLQSLIDKHFSGKIKQTPPRKSAVKIQERTREIYSFKFLEASLGKKDFLFSCSVEGGTYIRKICSDLGDMIGGGHMSELRRTKAGLFDESTLVTLDEFTQALDEANKKNEKILANMITPAEEIIKKIFTCVQVEKRAIKSLHHGKPLFTNDVISPPKMKVDERFAVFQGETFIGIYKRTKEEVILGRAEFVFD